MKSVYIYSGDKKLASEIKNLPLAQNARIIKNISEIPAGESGIIIVYKTHGAGLIIPPDYTAVALEEDTEALRDIKECGLPVVTCGFSSTSTINISGCGENEISFGIQRKIKALDGSIFEEGELPIALPSSTDKTAAMLWVAMAMLLVGEKEFRLLFDI